MVGVVVLVWGAANGGEARVYTLAIWFGAIFPTYFIRIKCRASFLLNTVTINLADGLPVD